MGMTTEELIKVIIQCAYNVSIYNRLLLNSLQAISQKYGHNL